MSTVADVLIPALIKHGGPSAEEIEKEIAECLTRLKWLLILKKAQAFSEYEAEEFLNKMLGEIALGKSAMKLHNRLFNVIPDGAKLTAGEIKNRYMPDESLNALIYSLKNHPTMFTIHQENGFTRFSKLSELSNGEAEG